MSAMAAMLGLANRWSRVKTIRSADNPDTIKKIGGLAFMAIPDFQTLMLPVLRASANGEVRISDVVGLLGTQLGLTETELSELLPSGKQTTFANRVNWAKSYLGCAG